MKRNLVIGAAVLAVAAFAGGAFAATQESAVNPRQAFIRDVAQRLHVTPQQLESAVRGAFEDQLNAAVKAGRLTKAEANAIRARAPAARLFALGALLGRPGLLGALLGPPAALAKLYGRPAPLAKLFGRSVPLAKLFGRPGPLAFALPFFARAHAFAPASLAKLKAAFLKIRQLMLKRLVAAKVLTPAQAAKRLARLQARLKSLHLGFAVPMLQWRLRMYKAGHLPPAPLPVP